MPINDPVIAAGPSIQKTDTATTVCKVLNTDQPPPFSHVEVIDGAATFLTYPPQWHGQMIVKNDPNLEYGRIYVAVEQDGRLQWKGVTLRYVVTDKETDRKKDPFSDFY